MKYLKRFETLYENTKLGYYVLCEDEESVKDKNDVKTFINNNVGTIIGINKYSQYMYIVEYENIPDEIEKFFDEGSRNMKAGEIIYWSDDKSELETYINSKKYNL